MDPRKQHRKVRTHLAMVLQPGQLLYGGMPAAPMLPAAALQPTVPAPQALQPVVQSALQPAGFEPPLTLQAHLHLHQFK